MKTKLLSLLFACFCMTASAQIDLKINPIGALFGSPDVSADFILSDKFSVEGGLGLNSGKIDIGETEFKRSGFSVFGAGKHYFNPNLGGDKFGVGIYSRFRNINTRTSTEGGSANDDYTRTKLALGLQIGWKRVSESGFIFEIDLGGGRALINNIKFDSDTADITEDDVPTFDIDLLFRIAIGYRIGGGK